MVKEKRKAKKKKKTVFRTYKSILKKMAKLTLEYCIGIIKQQETNFPFILMVLFPRFFLHAFRFFLTVTCLTAYSSSCFFFFLFLSLAMIVKFTFYAQQTQFHKGHTRIRKCSFPDLNVLYTHTHSEGTSRSEYIRFSGLQTRSHD